MAPLGTPRHARLAAATALAMLLTGCGIGGASTASRSPSAAEPTPVGTGDPASGSPAPPDLSGSPSPTETAGSPGGPGPTSSPASPLESPTPASPGSPGASGSCPTPTPVGIGRVTTEPRRTTAVVTLVSDGRTLTPGTREQGEFRAPALAAPDGTRVEDEAILRRVASLVSTTARKRVLLTRPEAPDSGAEATRRPFDAPGTYVLYSASAPLTAEVTVSCGGSTQRWLFTGETDPSSGLVNCAVAPPRANPLARVVYTSNC